MNAWHEQNLLVHNWSDFRYRDRPQTPRAVLRIGVLRLSPCDGFKFEVNDEASGQSKPRGNYTGERLKVLRPETYRRVVRLLAEPREHVSYRGPADSAVSYRHRRLR
jgi:hypothetical protein